MQQRARCRDLRLKKPPSKIDLQQRLGIVVR
jgi:hypothetical protein